MGRRYRKLGAAMRGATEPPKGHPSTAWNLRAPVLPFGKAQRGLTRKTTRYDGDAPHSIGYSINQTWGALMLCWRAYKIAAKDWHGINLDTDKAMKYAKRIRKLQCELGISISEFPNLGLYGTDPDDGDFMAD